MDALKAKIPWEFHFKALIQAKGFLKIIQFVSSFLVAIVTCDSVVDCALGCLCKVAGHGLKERHGSTVHDMRGQVQGVGYNARHVTSVSNQVETAIAVKLRLLGPFHSTPLHPSPPSCISFPPHSSWLSSPSPSWPAIQLRQELDCVWKTALQISTQV